MNRSDHAVLKILLASGADVNAIEDGETALIAAAWRAPLEGTLSRMKLLLDAGTNVEAQNN